MKILFLEPFFGGSHRSFAKGLADHSSHHIRVEGLPPRFWKWRMRGAALEFFRRIPEIPNYDLVLASDMMDITDLVALVGPKMPPVVIYFHENQLSYPLAPGEKRDFHLGFTNMVNALAARAVVFNSRFHRDEFIGAARKLASQMPDKKPGWMVDKILEKSRVIYPGCRFSADPPRDVGGEKPLIIWNHRWEYDKNPGDFFGALTRLKADNIPFSLALLGEKYAKAPPEFDRAKTQFKDELLAHGYVASREAYISWLKKGRVVVSTAVQENFGISVVEAVRHGCFPLLPPRLSYPEIMPPEFHRDILFTSVDDLVEKLKDHLKSPEAFLPARSSLADHCGKYAWEALVPQYDELFQDMAAQF